MQVTEALRPHGKVAVVAHDAGAANVLFAWLAVGTTDVQAFVDGPAAGLWSQRFPGVKTADSLDQALLGSDLLITGTGWQSDLEHQARQRAAALGILSVAVVDHWVNYPERFERKGVTVLPDEIWVADARAKNIAETLFPAQCVRQFENQYLAEQVAQIEAAPGGGVALYLAEPLFDRWGRDRPAEVQALDYAVTHLQRLLADPIRELRIRPHPSEDINKYLPWVTGPLDARIDTSGSVGEAINQADVVVGVETYALVIAAAAGRPVYSSLPPWAPAFRLPPEGIREIRAMGFD